MPTLTPPELVTNRGQAQELVSQLPTDLSRHVVTVDCSMMKASTPAFVDELIRAVVVARGARCLTLVEATPRVQELAARFADNHGVADRVVIQ